MLLNRGFTKRVVVFREFKGFREGTAKVLCLLIVFISYFSILIFTSRRRPAEALHQLMYGFSISVQPVKPVSPIRLLCDQ